MALNSHELELFATIEMNGNDTKIYFDGFNKIRQKNCRFFFRF